MFMLIMLLYVRIPWQTAVMSSATRLQGSRQSLLLLTQADRHDIRLQPAMLVLDGALFVPRHSWQACVILQHTFRLKLGPSTAVSAA